jgi:hypothetical protein
MTGSMVESRAGSRAEEDCGVRAEVAKIGRGSGVTRRTDATQWRPYPRQCEKGGRGAGYLQAGGARERQLGQHAVLPLPEAEHNRDPNQRCTP